MDGLKYSNVGDIVVINPKDVVNYWGYDMLKNGHAGLLDTDYIMMERRLILSLH